MSSTRSYRSEARAGTAATTRARIVASASQEILRAGYHATSIAGIARLAGVSPQTIYNSVGGKAALLKAAYDVALAGDDAPVPLSERPEIAAVRRQPDHAATLCAYAHLSRVIYDRVGGLLGVVFADGTGSDHELGDFLATIDRERRIGADGVVSHLEATFGLPASLTVERLVDHLWTLNSPEVFDRLVRRSGWSLDDYERWLAGQLLAGLTPLASE